MLDSGQMPVEAYCGYLAYIFLALILDYLSVLVLMLDSGQMPAEASDGYLAYIYFTLILDYLFVLVFTLDSGFNAGLMHCRTGGQSRPTK